MSIKSRQSYATQMRDSYFAASCIEIFFHTGSRVLPSQRRHVWSARGYYWRDTETGDWAGPYKTAESAEENCFAI